MSPQTRIVFALTFALIAATLLVTLAAAIGSPLWQEDGVALCTAPFEQSEPQLASDDSGGAIVVWGDGRGSIYAQRVDPAGTPLWYADGISLCAGVYQSQNPQVISDGSGGAVVTWYDNRSSDNNVYAQRLDSDGNTLWLTCGVTLCAAAHTQSFPQLAPGGYGGAIVTWQDGRSGSYFDIYAGRVAPSGNVPWVTDGISVCTAANNQLEPQITPDGSGGAIITWYDDRLGTGQHDIYAQRIDDVGDVLWETDGVSLCVASGMQAIPKIVSDDEEGAIVVWEDYRAASNNSDIYAQRVEDDGNTVWHEDGMTICAASSYQECPQIIPDGSGGAIIVWGDKRSGDYDIYAQRVDAKGDSQWYTDGLTICAAANEQGFPQLATDGSGGAIVTWYDGRTDVNFDIYAQWVDADGNIMWKTDGVRLCGATDDQDQPKVVSDGWGGGIVAWRDGRTMGISGYDIYAQRVGNVDGVYLPLAVKQY